jgi:EmrB/QacA subfamily drug resistance transporter
MAVLATCCLSLFLVTMDVTIVNVALPAIRRDLHASVSHMQWAIDGYTVVIASFLMLAGSTADRLGRRRVFQVGLALFIFGSFLCSQAPTIQLLVACRVIQALGGAMLNPVAMSIIVNTFTEPKPRAQAIGVWGAVVGISMALGPLIGGILTQTVGWRSVFWVNVPIGLAAIVLTFWFVPESRAERPRRVDPAGQALVVLALGLLTSALIEGPRLGWFSPVILGAFAVSLASNVALLLHERRRFEPLIDLRFFRSLPFSSATLVAVFAFSAFAGCLFLSSLYLQEVRGLSASHAGYCLLPTALAMFVCSPISGRLVGMGRARTALVLAGSAIALSAFLLTNLRADVSLVQLLVAFTVFGVGLGLVNAPITNAAVSGMPRAQAGVASALASTSRQVGATLGVALGGSIAGGGAVLGPAFAIATHPFWWLVVGCGLGIVVLGIAATGEGARRSAREVAHLMDAPGGPAFSR